MAVEKGKQSWTSRARLNLGSIVCLKTWEREAQNKLEWLEGPFKSRIAYTSTNTFTNEYSAWQIWHYISHLKINIHIYSIALNEQLRLAYSCLSLSPQEMRKRERERESKREKERKREEGETSHSGLLHLLLKYHSSHFFTSCAWIFYIIQFICIHISWSIKGCKWKGMNVSSKNGCIKRQHLREKNDCTIDWSSITIHHCITFLWLIYWLWKYYIHSKYVP